MAACAIPFPAGRAEVLLLCDGLIRQKLGQ
jgi:hypothetical protein